MLKVQIVAQAHTFVYNFVLQTRQKQEEPPSLHMLAAYFVALPPLDLWILGRIVTVQQLEQWIIEALSAPQEALDALITTSQGSSRL